MGEIQANGKYFSGEEIFGCEQAGVTPFVSTSMTSAARVPARFWKAHQEEILLAQNTCDASPSAGSMLRCGLDRPFSGHF
ncbi:hypothetical protein [Cupriavidus lacunae]|uniref:hypothetical protein n=1 Tax=Cupriavidus lacunae TaxID=2666307 RepID=UPI0010584598|nr:hypothetical protein [Cupriavidus lacunae]